MFSGHLTLGCVAAVSSALLYPSPMITTDVSPFSLRPSISSNHPELKPPIGEASTRSSAAVISIIPSAMKT